MEKSINQKRRLFIIWGLLGTSSHLSGCATQALLNNHNYTEDISSVLISEDGKKIVVISNSYHYVFDAPPIIAKTLKADFHNNVRADFGIFHVNEDGGIGGSLELSLDAETPESDRISAIETGYIKKIISSSKYKCEYKTFISGMRYRTNGALPILESQRLNKTYRIHIDADLTAGEKAARAPLTPIAVAVDGVLIIGAIPLLLFSGVGANTR